MSGTEPKMAQNFSYDLWLLDEGDDPNQATTLRAEEWVGLIDLSDAMGPSLLEASRTQEVGPQPFRNWPAPAPFSGSRRPCRAFSACAR